MEAALGWLILAALCLGVPALIAGLLYVFVVRPRNKASTSGAKWAQSHGLVHRPNDPKLHRKWKGAPFKWEGGSEDIIYGNHRGWNVQLFNYSRAADAAVHYTGFGAIGMEYYTVAVITLPVPRPGLEINSRGSVDSDQFHDLFEVQAEHPEFAASVLQPDVMHWMANDGRGEDLQLRFEYSELVIWQKGTYTEDALLAMADFGIDLLERMPQHAWR